MALGATIFKAELNIVDMDRHYYQQHSLTLAQHPSETDERLMIRLLVFALHASDLLRFTKGLSTDDEPDLWQKSLSDEIELWVELGLPSEKRLKKACGRAQQVIVYTYGTGSAEQWWKEMQPQLARFKNLSVRHLDTDITKKLAKGMQRNLDIQVSIQDSEVTWDTDQTPLIFTPGVKL
ncbi:MAG: YaeQ family protein [Porticoccaceae bacterium]|nr:YaeQ family protein [Porticoccaceae bacterium]